MNASAKLLVLAGLLVLPLPAWAQDIETFTNSRLELNEALDFALAHANEAIAALEARREECEKAMKGNVLDPALFKVFSLTAQEWRYAMSALHNRAEARCVNKDGVHHRALVALMQFRTTEKTFTDKNAIKTAHAPEEICCISPMFGSLIEMKYSKLDSKVRQRLEAIPGINEPFAYVSLPVEALRAVNQPPIP